MSAVKTTRKAASTAAKKTTSKKAAKTSKKVTQDDVWAIIAEIGKGQKELQAAHRETEKAIKETREAQREAHRETEMAIKETQKALKKLSENVGGSNRSMGELIEILIAAHLWEKFPEYGLKMAFRRLPIFDENREPKAEIDILLVDSEWAMAVEVKRQADAEDIKEHIVRMERILKYPPDQLKLRPGVKLMGALAGGIVTPECRAAAHEAGFFVLELTGEDVTRIPEPAGFKPKEW